MENAREGGVRNKLCGDGGVVKEWLTSVQTAVTNAIDWVAKTIKSYFSAEKQRGSKIKASCRSGV